MVGSDILEYGRPGEVRNNYTSGYGIEVNPEIQRFDFTKIELILKCKHAEWDKYQI